MKEANTPLMKQYWTIKSQYPEAMLLFRVGDFYETFGEDAQLCSKALGIVLTRKANGAGSYTQLAGFPYHALDNYLPKLVRAGYKVAVCDQLEDPKNAVKLVKRGVTELVTPGVAYNDLLLDTQENNYLCCAHFEKDRAGMAFLDVSTGSFQVGEAGLNTCDALLSRYNPREVVVQKSYEKGFKERFGDSYCVTAMDPWAFVEEADLDKLHKHFEVENLKGFGIDDMHLAIVAAGAALFYLETTRHSALGHLCAIQRIDNTRQMWLDRFSLRNLEIFPLEGSIEKGCSLIEVIDRTRSPMGARLLRRWIAAPLTDKRQIDGRLQIVSAFLQFPDAAGQLCTLLSCVGDIERLTAKAAAGRLNPKEAGRLKSGLQQLPAIGELCRSIKDAQLQKLVEPLQPCRELCDRLERTLTEDPGSQIGKGPVIAAGVDAELDRLRYFTSHGKEYLRRLQETEAARTGITSLKIGYNNIFGYYIEVRNTHKDKVPTAWIRKQTLVNAERYITQELKDYEEQILGAEEKILQIEQTLYADLTAAIREQVKPLLANAACLAQCDCLLSFASIAKEKHYCRPKITVQGVIDICQGRHPVLEALMPAGESYVPNDIYLDKTSQQIIILTGPNMAGKSALLRQTALIVLLAQAGSYVPAASAKIGIVDKLFTRVGASDNIARGESTFMVEMLESSAILHNISDNSLVLLDEIGRGTSTYDGLSIAWAIAEYLHEHPLYKAKTLFATHYHELNQLADHFPRIKNFHIAVKETGSKVIFLRTLKEGGIKHSFGIHVAAMAGMPAEVVNRARALLKQLEAEHRETPVEKEQPPLQLTFFPLDDPLLTALRDDIKAIDLNNLSPLQAFDILRELKRKLGLL